MVFNVIIVLSCQTFLPAWILLHVLISMKSVATELK